MAERSKKQIAAGHRRSLRTIAEKLRAMSCEWSEIDHYNECMLDEVASKVEEISGNLCDEEAEG